MDVLSFRYEDRAKFRTEFDGYLKLRHKYFVKTLKWPLSGDGGREQDQYDNPCAKYVLIHHNGTVIAGSRLLPDDADWHGWRHMAADTAAGKIKTMDADIIEPNLSFDGVWECSRVVIDAENLDPEARATAFDMLTRSVVSNSTKQGADALISISPPSLQHVLKGMGYRIKTAGPVFKDRYDGRRYRAMQMTDL